MTARNELPTLHENNAPTPLRFGPQLRDVRSRHGRSLGEMARFLGCSVPRLSEVEREREAPFDDLDIGRIARFLGIDPAPLWALAATSRVAWGGRFAAPLPEAPPPTLPGALPPEKPMISNAAAQTLVHVFARIERHVLTLPSPRVVTFDITGRPAPRPKVKITWVFRPAVSAEAVIDESGALEWSTHGWASVYGPNTEAEPLAIELGHMQKAMPS
jgi:transcriptional regulator with XRE-family HTH domain